MDALTCYQHVDACYRTTITKRYPGAVLFLGQREDSVHQLCIHFSFQTCISWKPFYSVSPSKPPVTDAGFKIKNAFHVAINILLMRDHCETVKSYCACHNTHFHQADCSCTKKLTVISVSCWLKIIDSRISLYDDGAYQDCISEKLVLYQNQAHCLFCLLMKNWKGRGTQKLKLSKMIGNTEKNSQITVRSL